MKRLGEYTLSFSCFTQRQQSMQLYVNVDNCFQKAKVSLMRPPSGPTKSSLKNELVLLVRLNDSEILPLKIGGLNSGTVLITIGLYSELEELYCSRLEAICMSGIIKPHSLLSHEQYTSITNTLSENLFAPF